MSKELIEFYETETGCKCPSNQIEYSEWHNDFVAWMKKRLTELLSLNNNKCSEQKLHWMVRHFKFSSYLNLSDADKNYMHQTEMNKFVNNIVEMYLKRNLEPSDIRMTVNENIKSDRNKFKLIYNNVVL